ncbi:MAG: inositol monophosphatase family protein [bacterium]
MAAEPDWTSACRRIVIAQRELFAAKPSIADRTVYDGRGEGGDRSLVIDRRAEDIIFAELEAIHDDGHSFTAISEERGTVQFGDGGSPTRVVIDPIDGSLNARRTLPSHSLSVAVASGMSMEAVEFGYVYDFGADEEFVARAGAGSTLDDQPLHAEGPGYGLEVVGLEAAKPERILPLISELEGKAYRIRAIGSIAITLCYVAAGRLDGMLTARGCRSVDAAAAQLIAREAGAAVEFSGVEGEASLDLAARYHVTAALDLEMLEALRPVQARAEAVAAVP